MRQINKYKFLNKLRGHFKLSKRILKFKRPKWANSKKPLFESLFNETETNIDVYKQTAPQGWEYSKKHFRNKINFGRVLLVLNSHDRRKKAKLQKKNFVENQKKINSIFFKRYFDINYFISSVFLASTSQESKKYIESKKVYLNETLVTKNFSLKEGDLLSVETINPVDFLTTKKNFNVGETFSSFYEYDYYTQSFYILKNLEEVDETDVYLSLTTNLV